MSSSRVSISRGSREAIRCLKRYLARHLYRLMEGAMHPA